MFITYSFKRQSTDFKKFRDLLYVDNKKQINKKILEMLNPTSIAL